MWALVTRFYSNRIAISTLGKLGAIGAAFLLGAAQSPGIELIRNGSFEEGVMPDEIVLDGWSDAPSGSNNRGLDVSLYHPSAGRTFEYPPGIPSPPDFDAMIKPQSAGEYFGYAWGRGNGSGLFGSARQVVDTSDHGGRPYRFSAWLASLISDEDYALVSLEFFSGPDGTGQSLGSVLFDGNDRQSESIVGSLNLEGVADPTIAATQDNWTLYGAFGTVPSSASSGVVQIRTATGDNNGNDGFVDLVSLQVVPEPSAAAMLALGTLGLAVVVRTTRPAARRFANSTRHLDRAAKLPARGTLRFLVAWPENASCNEGKAS